MTNADRIRAMSDEELAEWLEDSGLCPTALFTCGEHGDSCTECWFNWLKQEAKDGK